MADDSASSRGVSRPSSTSSRSRSNERGNTGNYPSRGTVSNSSRSGGGGGYSRDVQRDISSSRGAAQRTINVGPMGNRVQLSNNPPRNSRPVPNNLKPLDTRGFFGDSSVIGSALSDPASQFALGRNIISGIEPTGDMSLGGSVNPFSRVMKVNPHYYGPESSPGASGTYGDIFSHEGGHLVTQAITSSPVLNTVKPYNPFEGKNFWDVGVGEGVNYALDLTKNYVSPQRYLSYNNAGLDALNNNVASLSQPGYPYYSRHYQSYMGDEMMSRIADRESAIRNQNQGLKDETSSALRSMLPSVYGGTIYSTLATGREYPVGYSIGDPAKQDYIDKLYSERGAIANKLLADRTPTAYEVYSGASPMPSGGISDIYGGWVPSPYDFDQGVK